MSMESGERGKALGENNLQWEGSNHVDFLSQIKQVMGNPQKNSSVKMGT